MNLNHLLLTISLVSCISIADLEAQEPWSLEECITYALENNIQIKQAKINTEYNENLLSQSKSDLLPNLSGSGSYGISFGRALDQTTYEFTEDQTVQSINTSLNSSATLFSGFQKLNTIRQNEFDLMKSVEDLEKLKNDVSLNIAAAYLQILINEELLDVALEQMEITKQQVTRTQQLVDAGSLARGSLLEINAQLAADELTVINAENSLSISYLTLAQLLELDSAEDFQIIIPEIRDVNGESLLSSVNDIFKDALQSLPQIRSSEYQLESSLKGLDIAKGSRYPRLGITASYGTGYSDTRQRVTDSELVTQQIGVTGSGEPVYTATPVPVFTYGDYALPDQLKDNASTNLFLNLSVPIFSNFQIKNNINNAKLMVENDQLALENQKNILYKEIQQAYADAVASLKKFRASEKALESMQESFKYTREKYEVGLVNAVDFNVAQSQLIFTGSELIRAKYDFIFKTSILDFYRGKPIKIDY